MAVRIVQLSDTHLSGARAYAAANFDRVVDWLNDDPPAVVVNTGDIALDDPDDADDRIFARRLHERITARVVAIPGNHDVGDSGPSPWQGQRVDPDRVDAFVATWGADRFSVDVADWRLIGIDNLLLGELPTHEAEQYEWLREELRGPEHVGLFMHKPLCVSRPEREDRPGWSVPLSSREALLAALAAGPVRFVASGHLHRGAAFRLDDGLMSLWAPSTGFVSSPSAEFGPSRCGVSEIVLDGPTVRWREIDPGGLRHRSSEDCKAGADAMRRAPLFAYDGPA